MADPRSASQRLFDLLFGVLLRARVRRVRRWAFLVTLPLSVLVGRRLGLTPDLDTGLLAAAAVAVLDALVLLAVLVAGARVLGRERRDALLDLLMHPVARRLIYLTPGRSCASS